jgi:prolyl-tRNA editing enzyme YbaK/EbsC (Cys-tRNA(Pro) deacylase)
MFDEAIARCKKVSISSGDPMVGLELDPQDLMRGTNGRLAPIAE